MPTPILKYYRLRPTAELRGKDLLGAIIRVAVSPEWVAVRATDRRGVVFISNPLATDPAMFVSQGALELLIGVALPVEADDDSISRRELPKNLVLLVGDQADSTLSHYLGEGRI